MFSIVNGIDGCSAFELCLQADSIYVKGCLTWRRMAEASLKLAHQGEFA